MTSWDRKKVELRRLEADIEAQLIQLENMDVSAEVAEIKGVQQDASRLISGMQAHARTLLEWADTGSGEEAAKLRQNSERYEAIAAEKQRALAHVIQSLNSKRSKHSLLSDVQHDLEEYNESHSSRMLDKEGDHLQRATQDAQRLHDQATASHQQMKDQYTIFARAADRASHIVSMAPGIDGILSKIQSKRQRDSMYVVTFFSKNDSEACTSGNCTIPTIF